MSNILYYGVQAIISFVTFPLVFKYFGKEQYGTLAYVLSIITFSQILNVSLNMTLTKYIAEFFAVADKDALQGLIKNSYTLSLVANSFVAIALFASSFLPTYILRIDSALLPQFVVIIKMLAVFSLLNGVLQVPKGILLGLQHYSLANLTTLPVVIAPALCVILFEFIQFDVKQYVFVLQVAMFASGVLAYIIVVRILPEVEHGFSLQKIFMKKIAGFNAYHILNQLSDILTYTTDKIILQQVIGAVAVANYSVVERPNQLVLGFTSLPLSAIVPACSKAYAEHNNTFIDKVFIIGARFYIFITLPVLCTLTFVMKRFLIEWMGLGFEFLTIYAQLFMSTMIAAVPFRVFSHLLVAKGRISEIVNVKIVYSLINVVLSYIFTIKYGFIGVIIPTLFFWFFVYPSAWLYLMKSESVSIKKFTIKVLLPSLLIIVVCYLMVTTLDSYLKYNLFMLILIISASVLVAYMVIYLFVFGEDEKIVLVDAFERIHTRLKLMLSTRRV